MRILNESNQTVTQEDELLHFKKSLDDFYNLLLTDGLNDFSNDGKLEGEDGNGILQMMIEFYKTEEQYEKCAFLYRLQIRLKQIVEIHS